MSYTKVRNYTDKELLDHISKLKSFNGFPDKYWLLGVMSSEDTYNVYDDKFYLYKGTKFILATTGTCNSGGYGLKNFHLWNKKGVAQIKPNEWYYNVWKRGIHTGSSGSMPALIQEGRSFKVIRDSNKNSKSGDSDTWSLESWTGLNFHCGTYNLNTNKKISSWFIGGWSTGCQVVNNVKDYNFILSITKPQEYFTYCLIKEF